MVHTEKTHFVMGILGRFLFFVGLLLILVGFIGLFIPFVPGIFLIFAGLALMGEKRVHLWWLKRKQ